MCARLVKVNSFVREVVRGLTPHGQQWRYGLFGFSAAKSFKKRARSIRHVCPHVTTQEPVNGFSEI
jgi:hypothetical protein